MRRETLDARETLGAPRASRLTPRRVSGLTSRAPWPKVKLGEVCASISDGDHLPPPKCESGIPFVTISDIKNNKFDLSNTRFVPKTYFDTIDEKRRIRKGDVLYSVVGSYGIPVYADTDLEIAFKRHIAILKPSDTVDSRFLYYSMLCPAFYNAADNVAIGAAQKTITLSALRNLEIPLPPLSVQRRVADILSAYDDLIENNRRRIAILEETARLAFQTSIVEGAWESKPVTALIDVNPEVPKPKCGNVRYVPMSALSTTGMTVDLTDSEMRAESTSVRFVNGDVLLARITPCLENGKTAYVNFLEDGEIGCGSSEFIVLRGKRVSSYFTYCLSRLEAFRGIAIKSMVGASGRQRVQLSCFSDISIQFPDKATLKEFDTTVEPMFKQISVLSKQNASLATSRDMLLPRLIKGSNN